MPATPETCSLAPELPFGSDFARHAAHLRGKGVELIDHRVDRVFQLKDLALYVHGDFAREVAAGHGGGDFGDVPHLTGEVVRHRVDVVREILPRASHIRHLSLSAELALCAYFARHPAHLGGKGVQLIHHGIHGFLELKDLAFHVHCDLARKIAARDGRRHVGDIAHLRGEIRSHRVNVVGEILPCPSHAADLCLTAELALGADLSSHTGYFGGEPVQLIHHCIDGVLEFEDFALDVHGDRLRKVSICHGSGDVGDVAHLGSEIGSHRVDVVGEVLPGTSNPGHDGLSAQFPFGSDLARDAGHFRSEGIQLVYHRIDGFLQLKDFPFHIHGDLARQVASRDRRGDVGDIAHLRGEVVCHRVDVVGEILPRPGNTTDLGLAAEFAFRPDLPGHACDFGGKGIELIHHGVDGFLQLENLSLDIHGDLPRQVAACDRCRDVGNVAHLRGEVARHLVDAFGEVLPDAGNALDLRLSAELALGADFARDTGNFRRENGELVDHAIYQFGRMQKLAFQSLAVHFERHHLPQIALCHCPDCASDLCGWTRKVVHERVERFDFVGPTSDETARCHALSQTALLSDHSGDMRSLPCAAFAHRHHLVEDVGDFAFHSRPSNR